MRTLLFLFLLSTTPIFSQDTFYVSTTGDNNNTGTETAPYLTIEKALNSIDGSGGTCIIKGGTYHEEITISDKNNITIKAFDGEQVIIDGTINIDQIWTQYPGNSAIYETTLTEDIWQLFIEDNRQVMARWPNAQFHDDSVYDLSYWGEGDANQGSNGTMVDTGALGASGINALGALAIANVGSFKTWTVEVTSHTPGSNTFNYETANSYKSKHHYYFLEGKLEFLNTENEWFYDATTKKLYVWGNPTGKKTQGKVQSYAFTFDNCSNITIEKLNFFGTTVKAFGSNSKNITINNSNFSYPSCSKRMLGDKGAPKTTELINNSSNTVTNFKIYQCLFEHTDGEAFYMNGEDNIVEDCYFHHIDYSVSSLRNLMTSVVNNGANGTFTQNTVHTTGASSTVYYVKAPKVSYNDISNTGLVQSDGSIVQVTRISVDGSEIHHNWFHDSAKSGMRYDAPISSPEDAGINGLVHHNVFWNLGKAMQIKGDFQQLYNNTCFGNVSNDISVLDEEYPDGSHSNSNTITQNNAADRISGHRNNPMTVPGTVDHNIYSTTSTDYGIKALLNDPDNFDFTPKDGSELIDAGLDIPGITDGFTGSAPDIGAYEREDTWVAGVTWEPDFYPWSFLSLGIEDSSYSNMELSIFPNPATEEITIKSTFEIKNVLAFNLLGKQVLSENNFNEKIDISSLNSGVYILRIQPKNGTSISRKIVIK